MYSRAKEIAAAIEAVATNPFASRETIDEVIEDAKRFGYGHIVVPLSFTKYASDKLEGTGVGLALPIGTPVGVGESTDNKIQAGRECLALSKVPVDVDMIMNTVYFRSGMYDEVFEDIKRVREAFPNNTLKVIIEALTLDDEQMKIACDLVMKAGADYIKTTTGMHGPTTPEVIKRIRDAAGYDIGIKAAGGIRTLETIETMMDTYKVDRFGMNVAAARELMESLSAMD